MPDATAPNTIQPLRGNTHAPASAEAQLAASIFVAGGEVGELCRRKDWSATPLGPLARWPQSLKTAVSLVMGSAFPMIILWGPELIQIYNDAYRMMMGAKHPLGLGQPSHECWPEVTHLVDPIYRRVFAGETISLDEAVFPLAPHGHLEDTYLTLCYTPIRDELGEVAGIFVVVFNVTAQVQTRLERDRALAEVRAERQRLMEIFQQSPSFVATLRGPDHVFEMCNQHYNQLIGHRDVIGKPVREALPEVVEQGFVELLDMVYRTGEPFVGTEVLVLLQPVAGGPLEEHYVNFVYQPLRDADDQVTGILAHGVTVTDQVLARREVERKAEELERLTQALERSNRELDQFAYVTSHDLKAPLRGIANLSGWIEEDMGDTISPEVREHFELLRGRVYRMEALIDGILAYSRAGRNAGKVELVEVGRLLDEVVDLLAPPANVTIELEPGMPTLLTERLPLQQVFSNLISNAIKHHPGPEIRIQVTARDRGRLVEFAVADNGPGIAPQYHERIFGIFQTLESRDKVEGSGLGLALVKKIVEHYGGTVWLESDVGQGATFFFTWPQPLTARGGS